MDVAVIRLPRISNFTDFAPLESHPALGVRYVTDPAKLGSPDLAILPGTKSTMQDLLWLRTSGLEAAIHKLAAGGTPVLGVCGGYQMLGSFLRDPEGVEGGGELAGLGLLPCETVFTPQKTRTRMQAEVLAAPFAGARLDGYEIHMGQTRCSGGQPFCRLHTGAEDGTVQGNVFGTYLHGLFDTGSLTDRLAAWLLERKGLAADWAPAGDRASYKETQYDQLAAGVRAALDMPAIYRAMEEYSHG